MWWLSSRDGASETTSLLHARMLAAVHKIGFVSQFANGHQLSPELAALIPDDCIGRPLSLDDATQLYAQLEGERAVRAAS
jgi:hypothetical protein